MLILRKTRCWFWNFAIMHLPLRKIKASGINQIHNSHWRMRLSLWNFQTTVQRFSTRFNCFTWQTIATCMHCCQVMNGRPLEGMIAATSIFFPVYWCSHQRNLPPALQPSGLSTWVLMHWPGYRAFFLLLQCRNKGQNRYFREAVRIQSVTGGPCNIKLAKTLPLMPWCTVKNITPFAD